MSKPTFTHTEEQVMVRENSIGLMTPQTKTTMTTNVWMWQHRWSGKKNRVTFQ